MIRFGAALLAVCVGAMMATGAFAQARIGTTSLSKNEVEGRLGDRQRKLRIGDAVFKNEVVVTGQASSAQFLFNDETVLTVGAGSRVVLNDLVYNPKTKRGRAALNAVSGAFRFVSGSAQKNAYKVTTPVATIGIRGTIFELFVGRRVILRVLQGAADFCSEAVGCVVLNAGKYAIAGRGFITGARTDSGVGCGSSGSFATGGGRNYCSVYVSGNHPLYFSFFGRYPSFPSGIRANRAPVPNR